MMNELLLRSMNCCFATLRIGSAYDRLFIIIASQTLNARSANHAISIAIHDEVNSCRKAIHCFKNKQSEMCNIATSLILIAMIS